MLVSSVPLSLTQHRGWPGRLVSVSSDATTGCVVGD